MTDKVTNNVVEKELTAEKTSSKQVRKGYVETRVAAEQYGSCGKITESCVVIRCTRRQVGLINGHGNDDVEGCE